MTQAWTSLLIERNGRRAALIWAISLALVGGAGFVLLGALGSAFSALTGAGFFSATEGMTGLAGPPVPFQIMACLAPLPCFAAGAVGILVAGALATGEYWLRPRVVVRAGGCCRDERRIEEAAQPDPARRWAPLVTIGAAAVGAFGALLSAISLPALVLASVGMILMSTLGCCGPGIPMSTESGMAVMASLAGASALSGILLSSLYALAAGAFGIGLMATQRVDLLDE